MLRNWIRRKKEGKNDADRFRNVSNRESVPLRFPVAVRLSEANGTTSWTSVRAQETNDEGSVKDDHMYLNTSASYEWSSLLLLILQLPYNTQWQILMVMSIVFHICMEMFLCMFAVKLKLLVSGFIVHVGTIVVTDLIYLVDFIVAMLHNYWKSIRTMIKVKRRSKVEMVVDCITIIPASYLYLVFASFIEPGGEKVPIHEFFIRTVAFVRFYRVLIIAYEWTNNASKSHWNVCVGCFVTFLFMALHGFTCLWFYQGCSSDCEGVKSWSNTASFLLSDHDKTLGEWYTVSMYYTVNTICNIGLGDIHAVTHPEYILSIFGMLLGLILTTGYYIGTITCLLVNASRRRTLFIDRLYSIRHHLHIMKMGKRIKSQIITYYETLWEYKRGIKTSEEWAILPEPLQMEVAYDINVAHFERSQLFRDLSEPFLRKLSLHMHNEFFLPGSIIFHQNVAKNMMICVASGVIEILSDEDNESPMISFGTGTILGEVSMLLTVPAKATVRAATYTELQVLHKVDFFRMMINYPDIQEKIQRSIMERISRAIKREAASTKNEIVMSLFVSRQTDRKAIWVLKDKLRARQKISTEEEQESGKDDFDNTMLDMYQLSQNISDNEKSPICSNDRCPFILEPNTLFTDMWEYFVVTVTILVAFVFPYFTAYVRTYPPWLKFTVIMVTLLYIINLFMSCCTAIRNKMFITDKFLPIVYKRMESWDFYASVLASLPLEAVTYVMSGRGTERLFSMLVVNRLANICLVYMFFRKLERNLWANVVIIRMIKYTLFLLILCHWAGALLFTLSCYNVQCTSNSWFHQEVLQEVHDGTDSTCYTSPTRMAMYFGLVVMSGVGYGDIAVGNLVDATVLCCMMLTGVLMFGYGIAEFTATLTAVYRKRASFQHLMRAVKQFMIENRIYPSIQERVIRYFELQWNFDRGAKILMSKSLIYDATHELKQEVLSLDRINTLTDIPLFSMTDLDYVQLIAAGAKILTLPPGEIITYAGSINREMYVVQTGYCMILTDISKKVGRIMGPNSHFGDIEMLFGIPMAVTVRTITHCKVISIEYSVYTQAISLFPFIMREMQDLMESFSEEAAGMGSKRKTIHFDKQHVQHLDWRSQLCENIVHFNDDIRASFVSIKRKCAATGERYSEPFRTMGKWRYLKYLLLPYCILPDSRFLKLWVFFRIVAAITVGVVMPFQIATSPYYMSLLNLMYVLDIFAYVDLYMMFHVAYYNQQGLLITHPSRTARNYLTSNFVIDFFACFPFEYVMLLARDHTEGHTEIDHLEIDHPQHCLIRLMRCIQMYRLPGAIAYVEKNILRKMHVINIIKFVPIVFVLINVCASGMVLSSCTYKDHVGKKAEHKLPVLSPGLKNAITSGNPNMKRVMEANVTLFEGRMVPLHIEDGGKSSKHTHDSDRVPGGTLHMHCVSGSWIKGSHFAKNEDPLSIYIISYYWVTATATRVGFGDITPLHDVALSKTMVIVIVATLVFGYMFASVSSNKASINNVTLLYQEMIQELITFMDQEAVDQDLQKRLVDHFHYVWRRSHGVVAKNILDALHSALMEDAVACMYERTLREVPLFEKVEPSFFRVFGRHVQQTYIMRGETIIRSQDVQSNIYIIYRGKVEVLSSYNEMVACMGPGGLFGNIASISASICSVTIVASRNVDALVISSEVFYNVLKLYPTVLANMDIVLRNAHDFIMPTTIIHEDSSISIVVEDEDEDEDMELRKRTAADHKESTSTMGSNKTTMTTSTTYTTMSTTSVGLIGTVGPIHYLLLPHKWFKFGAVPTSLMFAVMSHCVFVASIINCVTISYSFSFQDENQGLLISMLSLEIVFYVKILLVLHEAFPDKYGDYICDNKKIRERFFKDRTKVLVEVVPNLPIDLLCLFWPYEHRLRALAHFRLLHMLRFIYIYQYFHHRSSLLMANKVILSLLSLVVGVIMIAHISACIWYFNACPYTDCSWQSWGYYNLNEDTEPWHAYIKSLYLSVSIFTGTGYGDIVPHQISQVIYCIFLMILSKFIVAMFIAVFTEVVNSKSFSLINYEYGVVELRDSLLNQYLSSHQMDKVWNYVQQLWKHGRGKQMPRLILQAPYVLKSDVMNAMYGQHLRNSYVFAKLDDDFLRQLTVRLFHFVYFKGNYIVQHGDTDQKMYFIHRGEVDVLTVHSNLTETIHDVLKPGDVFGMAQGLFHGLPHHFSFRAKTTVDIVTLNLDSWYSMLKYFPEAKAIVYKRAANIYAQV